MVCKESKGDCLVVQTLSDAHNKVQRALTGFTVDCSDMPCISYSPNTEAIKQIVGFDGFMGALLSRVDKYQDWIAGDSKESFKGVTSRHSYPYAEVAFNGSPLFLDLNAAGIRNIHVSSRMNRFYLYDDVNFCINYDKGECEYVLDATLLELNGGFSGKNINSRFTKETVLTNINGIVIDVSGSDFDVYTPLQSLYLSNYDVSSAVRSVADLSIKHVLSKR